MSISPDFKVIDVRDSGALSHDHVLEIRNEARSEGWFPNLRLIVTPEQFAEYQAQPSVETDGHKWQDPYTRTVQTPSGPVREQGYSSEQYRSIEFVIRERD